MESLQIAYVVMCLVSDPTTCERHEVVLDSTELQCQFLAMEELAKYIRPGFVVQRFGCTKKEN